MEKTGFEA